MNFFENLANGFEQVQRHPLTPIFVIIAVRTGEKPFGLELEPGTYLLKKGQAPMLLGSDAEFERIGFGALGVTQKSLDEL
jgi:hypothetical protein